MTAAFAEQAGAYAATRAKQAGQRAAGAAERARVVPGDRQYQGVILAEFLVAVLLVTMSPLASGGSAAAKAKGTPSPYDTNDLRQLVAVGGVYFVLALISSGNRGRLAAWIGGLVLLAIGMSKAGQGGLGAITRTLKPDTGLGAKTAQTAQEAV